MKKKEIKTKTKAVTQKVFYCEFMIVVIEGNYQIYELINSLGGSPANALARCIDVATEKNSPRMYSKPYFIDFSINLN